jgi:uncharacterized phage protein (TIGR01671 family)
MRQIKFRAWDGKEMIYGLSVGNGNVGILNPFGHSFIKDVSEYDLVMQFTGLQDRNGKDVYEGDVLFGCLIQAQPELTKEEAIKINSNYKYITCMPVSAHPDTLPIREKKIVEWDSEGAKFNLSYYGDPLDMSNYYIGGNIYERPDIMNESILE